MKRRIPARSSRTGLGRVWLGLVGLMVGLGALLHVEQAMAKGGSIDAAPLPSRKVRLDGIPREWPQLMKLNVSVTGSPKRGDPVASGIIGYDKEHLYVAMRVKDEQFVRTARFGSGEDYGELLLAVPRGATFSALSFRMYPGRPGKTSGMVKRVGGSKVAGAKIVEAPQRDGFSFEAKIPWKSIPGAQTARSGIRAALRYHDQDSGSPTVVATARGKGKELPLLRLEAERALYQNIIGPKGLDEEPRKVVVGNVAGDRMAERIAIYDRYLAVTGWNYRKGKEFYFQDLQILEPGDLQLFRLLDMTGDGRKELVLQRRVRDGSRWRSYLEVLHFNSSNDAPKRIFRHEMGIKGDAGAVTNQVAFKRAGKKWVAVVSQGTHKELQVDQWDEVVSGGSTQPALLPWQGIKSRRYEWRGSAFEMTKETTGKPELSKRGKGTRMWSGSAPPKRARRPRSQVEAASSDGRRSLQARPPTADERLPQLYRLYRTDRGLSRSTPKADFMVDVAAGTEPERVLVVGKDIVVFGPGFLEAQSYAYTTIAVKEADHILEVTFSDVTGDGVAEIVVRGFIPVKASRRLGGQDVQRHALFIYKVSGRKLRRIFAAETGRSVGDKQVLGDLAFIPFGDGMKIQLRPGSAFGWTEESYPFPQDRTRYGVLEPLLLPWSDMDVRTYVFDGEVFAQMDAEG